MVRPVEADTIPNLNVEIGEARFGNSLPLALIAGPCVLESRAHALEMASALKEIAARLKIGLVYKTSFDKANRTSRDSARGMGLEQALPIFAEIREKLQLPVLTDVHEAAQCAQVAPAVDVLQIPAFLCRQTDLLIAAAQTGRVLNVKKGQFLAPWDMKNVVAKITAEGNRNVLVTERGACFGYNTLVSDLRALPILARTTRCSSRAGRVPLPAESGNSCRCWRAPRWQSAWQGYSSKPTKTPTAPPQTVRTCFRSRSWKPCFVS